MKNLQAGIIEIISIITSTLAKTKWGKDAITCGPLFYFLAYKACGGKSRLWRRNPFQYINAVGLITVISSIHILQAVFLFAPANFFPLKTIDGDKYVIIVVEIFVLNYLSGVVFSKRILAKGIKFYKDVHISRYAKLIVYGYFILNLLIMLIILRLRM